MKEVYETPAFDVIEYETEDVITTSGFGDNDLKDPWGDF